MFRARLLCPCGRPMYFLFCFLLPPHFKHLCHVCADGALSLTVLTPLKHVPMMSEEFPLFCCVVRHTTAAMVVALGMNVGVIMIYIYPKRSFQDRLAVFSPVAVSPSCTQWVSTYSAQLVQITVVCIYAWIHLS